MKKIGLFIACLVFAINVFSQDSYHKWIEQYLNTNFQLPFAQPFVLPNTEEATQKIALHYGGTTTELSVMGMEFNKSFQRVINKGTNQWDAGTFFKNQFTIEKDDRVLIAVWLRSKTGLSSAYLFAEHSTTFDKEAYSKITVSTNWQLYLVPFSAKQKYLKEGLNIGLHLATQDQTLEIGGMAVLNYKTAVPYNQLPIQLNLPLYDGADPNAPWRVEADIQIEKNRKADLKVKVLSNTTTSGYTIRAEMLQHDFKFGTAVVSDKFNEGNATSTYQDKLLNLDDKGHGFNEVVFENDLKWPGWEGQWFNSHAAVLKDFDFLKKHDISVRGHNLVWPGWSYSPDDINETKTPAYIIKRVKDHIKNLLSNDAVGNRCIDWDVINELTTNINYADHFKGKLGYTTGREFYIEIFKLVDSLIPKANLYLNDYVALEQADESFNGIEKWQSYIDEILAGGGKVEGLGFQGHFSAAPTGIPRVKEMLDQFWDKYHLPAKVTEYDISNLVKPEVQAKYMNDILTICFAHPSMKGFLMWGFWDGAHWQGNAPLYDQDWNLKPSGQAFVDLVFKKWWTDVTITSASNIDNTIRGYKGKYKITVTSPIGKIIEKNVDLSTDTEVTIDDLISANNEEKIDVLNIYPNPASSYVNIGIPDNIETKDVGVEMINLHGKQTKVSFQKNNNNYTLDTKELANGIYIISMKSNNKIVAQGKITIINK